MSDIIYVNWANKHESKENAKLDSEDLTWCEKDVDMLLELLCMKNRPKSEIYFAPEFYSNLDKLGRVIAWCNERKKVPVLFTYGLWIENDVQCGSIIDQLKFFGDFKIVFLIDSYHEVYLSALHLSIFIREAKKRFIVPEMMYISENSSFPMNIYDSDEVKKSMSIYFRRAKSGRIFFDKLKRVEDKYTDSLDNCIFSSHSMNISVSNNDALMSDRIGATINHINFNAIVLEITYFCNSKCDHCYTSCGPQSDRTLMPLDKIKRVLQEAAAIDCIKKRVHIGGGEATIFWKRMEDILCLARDLGFKNSIVTNGFWGIDQKKAKRHVKKLKEAGVVDIEFSIDAMHQQYIGNKSIHHILEAAEQYGIRVILRLCTTRRDDISEILRKIDFSILSNANIVTSRVVGVGRARTSFTESDFYLEAGIPVGSCQQLLNLTIDPKGNVYPCCAGSEICPSLRMGNCFSDSLIDILEQSRFDYMLRTLIHAGPSYFAGMLLENEHGHLLRSTYGNFCHLCNDIFSNEEKFNAVQTLFANNLKNEISSLSSLSSQQ